MSVWTKNAEARGVLNKRRKFVEDKFTVGFAWALVGLLAGVMLLSLTESYHLWKPFAVVYVVLIIVYVLHSVAVWSGVSKQYDEYVANGRILVLRGQTDGFASLAGELIDAEAGRKRTWLYDKLVELNKMQQADDADSVAIAARMQELIAELNAMVHQPVVPPND